MEGEIQVRKVQTPGSPEEVGRPNFSPKLPKPINLIQEQTWEWACWLCPSLLKCGVWQINGGIIISKQKVHVDNISN